MMNYLRKERETLEKLLPGLDAKLSEIPLEETEAKGNPAIGLYREHGGVGLVIPKEYGGLGASPLDVIQIQRALATRSPSLAIAINMHNCTVGAIPPCAETEGLLSSIAKDKLYLASGFSDGQTSNSIQHPNMEVKRITGGWTLTGKKKPCSLSESMDLLTASLVLPATEDRGPALALATIPANMPGIEVKPFHGSGLFAGAENNEVILNEVEVADEYISSFGTTEECNAELSKAFLWFELFVSAAYLGVVSNLVERVFRAKRGNTIERLALVAETEGSMTALEGVAHMIMNEQAENSDGVAKALCVRYNVQQSIERVSMRAAELLGGMAFVGANEIASLLVASRALAFHPPSRLSIAQSMDNYMLGEELIMP